MFSINLREFRGVLRQQHNSGAHPQSGGPFSTTLNPNAQLLLCWAESLDITIVSLFFMGAWIMVTGSMSLQVRSSD